MIPFLIPHIPSSILSGMFPIVSRLQSLARSFHTSTPLGKLEGDKTATTSNPVDILDSHKRDVLSIDPIDRTILQWQLLVDWNLQKQRPLVVIDPNDPAGIMYLTERDYRDLQKVCLSNDFPLTVIARKGSVPPTLVLDAQRHLKDPSSKNTPPFPKVGGSKGPGTPRPTMFRNGLWSVFVRAKAWLPTLLKTDASTGAIGLSRTSGSEVLKVTMLWGRQAFHYSGLARNGYCFRSLGHMGRHFQHILLHNGPKTLIARLKIYLFVVNVYVGGERLTTTHPLGIRIKLSAGLPTCFPKEVRDGIRSGSLPVIRWWATLLNMYKALGAPYGEADFSAIEADPYTGDLGLWCEGVSQIWENLWNFCGGLPPFIHKYTYGRFTSKAGPIDTNLTSPSADAWAWFRSDRNWALEYAEAVGDHQTISKMTELASYADMEIMSHKKGWGEPYSFPKLFNIMGQSPLGKLAYKLEAAGKIRVFALVDYWTHALLKPLHDWIFSILTQLPTDATFDQTGKLEAFVKRMNAEQKTEFFCYDLKSATDLIPLPLYVEVLAPVLGRRAAELWGDFLVQRKFFVPKMPKGGGSLPDTHPAGSFVKYRRGQPMGALSSWAGLALVHHFLVQLAWIESGGLGFFLDYLVLGDDIAIGNADVARCYLVICDRYGIKVGLAKSLVSKIGLINFANQTFLKTDNISPLSLKEELKARSWASRIAIGRRVLARWFPDSQDHLTSLLKRVVTVPMWNMLQGLNLLGKDREGLGAVLTLLAQNPFIGASADDKVGAEEIINWIEKFISSPISSSSVKRQSFLEDVSVLFYKETERAISKRVDGLNEYISALQVVSPVSRAKVLAGRSPIPGYPILNWFSTVEDLILPRVVEILSRLENLRVSITSAIGDHRDWFTPVEGMHSTPATRTRRDTYHGPGILNFYRPLGGLETGYEPDPEAVHTALKTIIASWLEVQSMTAFSCGTVLSPTKIVEAGATGKFGVLLKALDPERYLQEQENLKIFGSKIDPNLVKIPTAGLESLIVSHFGTYTPLTLVQPKVMASAFQQSVTQEEGQDSPVGIPLCVAESQFLANQPVAPTASVIKDSVGSIVSFKGTMEQVVLASLNLSREMRNEPLLRSISVEPVQVGPPGEQVTYLNTSNEIEVPNHVPRLPEVPVLRAGHDFDVPSAPSDVGYVISPTGERKVPAYLKERQARLRAEGKDKT